MFFCARFCRTLPRERAFILCRDAMPFAMLRSHERDYSLIFMILPMLVDYAEMMMLMPLIDVPTFSTRADVVRRCYSACERYFARC